MVVAPNLPAVLLFNVSNGFTNSIHLARPGFADTDPLSASASTDGSQVYVAACDQYPNNDQTQPCAAGSVHIVNTCAVLPPTPPPNPVHAPFQHIPTHPIHNQHHPPT